MKGTVKFYIVRHGQTMFNLLDRAQGWSDSPLTPLGCTDAARLGEGFRREGVHFAAACSSDSGRAIETAEILLEHCGQQTLPRQQDKRLREWCLGHMEGGANHDFLTAICEQDGTPFPLKDLNRRLREAADYIHEHLDSTGMSQSFDQIATRLTGALRDLGEAVAAQGGGNVLVVTHALSIKTIVYLLAHERLEEVAMIRNVSVCRFAYEGGAFQALELNDTHYLDEHAVPGA